MAQPNIAATANHLQGIQDEIALAPSMPAVVGNATPQQQLDAIRQQVDSIRQQLNVIRQQANANHLQLVAVLG